MHYSTSLHLFILHSLAHCNLSPIAALSSFSSAHFLRIFMNVSFKANVCALFSSISSFHFFEWHLSTIPFTNGSISPLATLTLGTPDVRVAMTPRILCIVYIQNESAHTSFVLLRHSKTEKSPYISIIIQCVGIDERDAFQRAQPLTFCLEGVRVSVADDSIYDTSCQFVTGKIKERCKLNVLICVFKSHDEIDKDLRRTRTSRINGK